MIVAIPSKGRAGKVPSQKYITQSHVFVPALEVAAYVAAGAQNVVAVPDSVRGITATRNWILENTADEWVVFVDDDLKVAGWVELLATKGKHRKLTESEMVGEWLKLFQITEQLQYRIWGIATHSSLCGVYPYKPFLFRTYVTASCMGIINRDGLRFNESFAVKEDYELCLRCIQEDGGIVGARHIYWENRHWGDAGGCADYRTQAMEMDAIRRLQQMYPGNVRRAGNKSCDYTISLIF